MIKKIALSGATVVILFLVIVALQPSEFRVARTATMAAAPAAVFEQVNDFHNWQAWSPWAKLDPAMKQNHEGAPAGTGAIYSWSGNDEVGQGRMTLTESRPYESVRIKLEFEKPFVATNTTEFSFNQEGDRTTVTWSMAGKNNFVAKAFNLIMNMDKVVGEQFDQGLANMKAVVEEAGPKP